MYVTVYQLFILFGARMIKIFYAHNYFIFKNNYQPILHLSSFFLLFPLRIPVLKTYNVVVNDVKIPIIALSMKLENKMKGRFIHYFHFFFDVTFDAIMIPLLQIIVESVENVKYVLLLGVCEYM